MTTAKSCTVTALHVDGAPIRMIRWGQEPGWRAVARCGDCGVAPRQLHHPGCDVQRCPLCGGQMMTCGCCFDEDGPDDEVVHDDDVPAKDLTTVRGIPCTTALRTVIDIAPDVDAEHLVRIVRDCLDRRLFTLAEAWARLDEADMLDRPGARLLRAVLPPLATSA